MEVKTDQIAFADVSAVKVFFRLFQFFLSVLGNHNIHSCVIARFGLHIVIPFSVGNWFHKAQEKRAPLSGKLSSSFWYSAFMIS